MLRLIKVLGIFAFGLAVGAISMAYLASRASLVYSHELELSFSFDQQRQAALAAKNGQWLEAAMAYNNIAAAESRSNKPFGVANQAWGPLFPLKSLVLEQMLDRSEPSGKGRLLSASISQARYAYALEKSGHAQDATIAWEKAMKIGTFKSIDAARDFAIKLLNQDIEFFSEEGCLRGGCR